MQQTSRKHHFVPAFYLKRWTGQDGQLIEWSKPHKSVVATPRHPDATGLQRGLYSFDDLPPEIAQFMEDVFLSHADNAACRVLQNILQSQPSPSDAKSRSDWSRFLILMFMRHPDVISELRAKVVRFLADEDGELQTAYTKIRKMSDPALYTDYLARTDPHASSKAAVSALQQIMDNRRLGNCLNRMVWTRLDVSRAKNRLLTSDRPLFIADITKPHGHWALAISPITIFVATNSPIANHPFWSGDPNVIVSEFNAGAVSRARRYVFSLDRAQERFITNRMSTNLEKTPFFPTTKYN